MRKQISTIDVRGSKEQGVTGNFLSLCFAKAEITHRFFHSYPSRAGIWTGKWHELTLDTDPCNRTTSPWDWDVHREYSRALVLWVEGTGGHP